MLLKVEKLDIFVSVTDLNAMYDTFIKILSNENYKDLGINALKFSKILNGK